MGYPLQFTDAQAKRAYSRTGSIYCAATLLGVCPQAIQLRMKKLGIPLLGRGISWSPHEKSKVCPKCKRRLRLLCFGVNNRTRSRRNAYCRRCVCNLSSNSYKRRLVKARLERAAYYKKNISSLKQYHGKWYRRHRSRRAAQIELWQKRNSAKFRLIMNAASARRRARVAKANVGDVKLFENTKA
jgi:hypothetical protein